jgi:bifunctional non-homologous end joining protein LigD
LDGYRLQVSKEGGRVLLYSRRGHEWSKRMPVLAEALPGIPAHSAVVDAKLCFPGSDGAGFFPIVESCFSQPGASLSVYVFDLLHLNGQNLKPLPLIERRQRLERQLRRAKVPCLHLVEA